MNSKLLDVHSCFPFFVQGPFYMVTPEGHFDDPNDSIMVSVWGDQIKLEISGPGELHEEIFDTADEVIEAIHAWLPTTETE